jgi:hypothetical protein
MLRHTLPKISQGAQITKLAITSPKAGNGLSTSIKHYSAPCRDPGFKATTWRLQTMRRRGEVIKTATGEGPGLPDAAPGQHAEPLDDGDDHSRFAILHDFCMCIPYGMIVTFGGMLALLFGGGLGALAVAGAGVALLIASARSLKCWKDGRSSAPWTLASAGLASWVAWAAWSALKEGASKFAAGGLLGLSTSAGLFFLYNIAAGGNPPRRGDHK